MRSAARALFASSLVLCGLVLLLQLATVEGQLVRGAGGEIGLAAYVQWGDGYNYVTDQILYTFNVIYNSSDGIQAYENNQLDFLAIDEPRELDPNYVQVPLLAGGIALTYSVSSATLNLSREALAKIWLGQVSHWNDSEITSLNPNANLPNMPIKLTFLPTRGVTKAFIRGLASFIDDIDPAVGAALRANDTLAFLPPVLAGTAVALNSTPDALIYMATTPGALVYLVNDGFYTPGLPIANLRNHALNIVAPTAASFQASLEDFSPTTANASELIQFIVDGHGSNSYPLSVLSLLLLKTNYSSLSCDGASLYMNELVWGLTNSKIGANSESEGYTSLTSPWRTRVLNQLATVNCDGARMLQTSLLTGTGPQAPFFSSYGFFFGETVTGVSTLYFTGGNEDQLIKGNVDYVGSVTGSYAVTSPNLLYMPIGAFPISIGYYVPELLGATPLVFDLDTLAKIYLGLITTWDDPAIQNLNQGVTLPSKSITVVLDESSGYTYPFTYALSKASQEFATAIGVSTNVTFPVANRIWALATDVAGAVNYNPYSMAFAPQFIFAGYGASLGMSSAYPALNGLNFSFANLTEATLVNAAGYQVRPEVTAVQAAMASASLDQYLTADLSGDTGDASWPITTFMYLVASRSGGADCKRSANLADMVWWILSAKEADNIDNINFVAPPTDYVKGKVLDALVTMTCDGQTVSSLAGCVYNGTICSDQGTCSNGACSCNATRDGSFCQDAVSSDGLSGGAIAGIVVGIVVPALLLLLLVIVAIIILARCLRKQKTEDWIIDPSELEFGDVLGTGGFGEVRKAVWRGTDVAVKTINSGYSNELRNAFLEEVSVMTALRHPNVVLFMAASTKPPALCIVMELMNLGSLHDVLHNELIPDIPLQLRIKILRHAAKGMYFLHSSGICHRDLKSLNLLLDAKWNVKVSDFGLTRFKEQLKKNQNQDQKMVGGSIHWTAPEVLNEASSIDYEKADMYSFGIILWEVHTRHDPYPGMSPAAIAVAVLRDNLRPELPDKILADYGTLMCDAWHTDPSVRPSFLEVMSRLDAMAEGSSSAGHSWTTSSSAGMMSATASHAPRSLSSRSTDDSGDAPGHAVGAAGTRAPTGEMAIVFTDIVRAMALWEFNAAAMKDATLMHNELMRSTLVQFDGYEVSFSKDGTSGEGSVCATFQDPEKAVKWCMHVQAELLKLDWPVEILTHPAAAEEWGDVDDRVIYRGPRVRIGVHVGQPRRVVDPVTRRVEFVGPPVNTAARITTLAQGGQVLLSNDAWDKLKDTPLAKERNRCSYLGKYEMPDSPQGARLYELRSPGLEGRFFGGAARKYKDVPDDNDQADAEPTSMTSEDDDQLLEIPEGRAQEDSFLTSANLCRWIIDYKEIQMGKQVGMGSYGLVFRGRWKGIDVAVKRFIKQKLTERRLLEFRAEMAFLSELNHPNVVLFIGACVKRPNLCIVTEFVQRGSLRDMLADRTTKLPWLQRLGMLRSAAMGVNFLHTLSVVVIHRDLKSSNLLVDENMNVKVADFGFARLKEENATMTRCGTPCWTAPEIIRGERYSEKADVYSFGVVMWEILTRKQPFGNRNFMGVSLDVLEGKRPQVPVDCPEAFHKLMTRCWHAKPDKRPSMSEVVESLSHLIGEDSLLSQTS